MKSRTSIAIRQDLPEYADDIIAAAGSDPGLKDALRDYEQACERMGKPCTRDADRELWSEIRTELAAEMRRLYLALNQDNRKPH